VCWSGHGGRAVPAGRVRRRRRAGTLVDRPALRVTPG